MDVLRGLYRRVDHLVHELMKFGVVGVFAFLIDVGIFNALLFAGGEGPLHDKPLTAKTMSVVAATTFAYVGNRFWTFRHRGRQGLGREYSLFVVFNAIGLVIALSCLGFSRYILDLRGPIADNLSANVIGLGLATMFRFWSYRRFVFPEVVEMVDEELGEPVAPGAGRVGEGAPAA